MYKYCETINKYRKEKVDRIEILVPKGKKEEIKSYAQAKSKNLSNYIVDLIYRDMGKDIEEKEY
jgi:uncharacterized protein (DUF1778 family)